MRTLKRTCFSLIGATLLAVAASCGSPPPVVAPAPVIEPPTETVARMQPQAPHTDAIWTWDVTPDGKYLLTGSRDGTVRVWDRESNALLRVLVVGASVEAVVSSQDGLEAGTVDEGLRVKRWDLRSGKLLASTPMADVEGDPFRGLYASAGPRLGLHGSPSEIQRVQAIVARHLFHRSFTPATGGSVPEARGERLRALAFSPDGRFLAVGGTRSIQLWDLHNVRLVRTFRPSAGKEKGEVGVCSVAFSRDGRRVLTSSGLDRLARLWSVDTGRELRRFDWSDDGKDADWSCVPALFAVDERRVVTPNKAWDVLSGEGRPITEVDDASRARAHGVLSGHQPFSALCAPCYGPAAKLPFAPKVVGVPAVRAFRGVEVLEPSGKVLRSFGAHLDIRSLGLTPDGAQVISAGDTMLRRWDLATGELLSTLAGHGADVDAVAVSADGRYAASASGDGTVRVWLLETSASVALMASGESWVAYTDDHYFDASHDGTNLVFAVDGLRWSRVEQLGLRNARPDKLFERLGLVAPDVGRHFRAVREQRLSKLGLADGGLQARFDRAPEATLVRVEREEKNATVTLSLRATDADLASYNLLVNGVPVHGAEGKEISGRERTHTELVELGAGKNKIELTAFDVMGAEARRVSRTVTYPEKVRGDLYFLGFGVSKYKNPALSLRFAHKDVLDLADVFRAAGRGYKKTHIHTFVNDRVTTPALREARALLDGSKVDDTVVVFVAGLGAYTRDVPARYMYVTYDTDPGRLGETAAPFELIEDLFDGIAPRQRLLLVDVCESSDRDAIEDAAVLALVKGRGLVPRTSPALLPKLGAARPYLLDRPRSPELGRSRRSGAIVLSSARPAELSFESDSLQNGVFAEQILLGLTTDEADSNGDGVVDGSELRWYVSRTVAGKTIDLQHPIVEHESPSERVAVPFAREARAIVDRRGR